MCQSFRDSDIIMPKKKKQQQEKQLIDKLEVKPGMVVRVHQKIKEINPKGEEKNVFRFLKGQ